MTDEFDTNDVVQIHGLKSAAGQKINDLYGVVRRRKEDNPERWLVTVAGTIKALKGANLKLVRNDKDNLHTGDMVEVKDLKGAADLNGQIGEVCWMVESGRYVISLDGNKKGIKFENLELMVAAETDGNTEVKTFET